MDVNKISDLSLRKKSISRAKEEEIMIFRVLPGGTIVSPEYGTPSTR